MSDYGIFESLETSAHEQKVAAQASVLELDHAIHAVGERFGEFLGAATDKRDFDDRVALVKSDMLKVVADYLLPRPAVVRKVVASQKPDFGRVARDFTNVSDDDLVREYDSYPEHVEGEGVTPFLELEDEVVRRNLTDYTPVETQPKDAAVKRADTSHDPAHLPDDFDDEGGSTDLDPPAEDTSPHEATVKTAAPEWSLWPGGAGEWRSLTTTDGQYTAEVHQYGDAGPSGNMGTGAVGWSIDKVGPGPYDFETIERSPHDSYPRVQDAQAAATEALKKYGPIGPINAARKQAKQPSWDPADYDAASMGLTEDQLARQLEIMRSMWEKPGDILSPRNDPKDLGESVSLGGRKTAETDWFQRGWQDYVNGSSRAPALNPGIMEALRDKPVGDPETTRIMTEWGRGWDAANLADDSMLNDDYHGGFGEHASLRAQAARDFPELYRTAEERPHEIDPPLSGTDAQELDDDSESLQPSAVETQPRDAMVQWAKRDFAEESRHPF